ncbi:hypothetical protein RND59_14785 [Vibrio ruber]|uniref:hypothetical protein n=1 Tax=Vibrio ruber TaxID=184755 RepID=UPI00289375FB|nr:hypothetical protein [Vibrio ruber]WNJ95373.1 hypothetical protein RND59_14785 [Vibrio ruber]
MLDHDFTYFGCGNKLSANELISNGFVKDFSSLCNDANSFSLSNKTMSVSVDTLMPFTSDIKLYVEASYSHCANDLYSTGVKPSYATASIGLSSCLTKDEMIFLVKTLSKKFEYENVSCLKYHTYYSDQTTITITLLGELDSNDFEILDEGMSIIMTKPIVMHNQPTATSSECSEIMICSNKGVAEIIKDNRLLCKDISGFGLVGSILPMLYHTDLKANLNIDDIKTVMGDFEEDQECSSKRNLSSFRDYLYGLEGLSTLEKSIISIGQTNGPMIIFTHKPIEHVNRLNLIGCSSNVIGEVVKMGDAHSKKCVELKRKY